MLYGTVITPQKDDAPRQSSSSPSLLYNNNNYSLNTFYRPNVNNYGTTNLYINRSQQKLTTVPAQATARKNGKQKSNGKGNKNSQRTSTTPRPVYTTVMLNQYSTGKSVKNKSKITQNGSSSTFNRVTSTMRPRTTTKMPNSKSHLNFGNGSKNNNNLVSSPKDKLEAANSNIFEKSPGKAPKQVKEATPSIHDTMPTRSPSMSRMFERYEKIEQIYPELKPYKDNNNPTYFTVTNGNGNGKPSRENSKSFSSFVSVNSAPQKKNSPSDISTVARQQVISSSANEMNGKGTNYKSIYLLNFFPNFLLAAFSYFSCVSLTISFHNLFFSCFVVWFIDLHRWVYHLRVSRSSGKVNEPINCPIDKRRRISILFALIHEPCKPLHPL